MRTFQQFIILSPSPQQGIAGQAPSHPKCPSRRSSAFTVFNPILLPQTEPLLIPPTHLSRGLRGTHRSPFIHSTTAGCRALSWGQARCQVPGHKSGWSLGTRLCQSHPGAWHTDLPPRHNMPEMSRHSWGGFCSEAKEVMPACFPLSVPARCKKV